MELPVDGAKQLLYSFFEGPWIRVSRTGECWLLTDLHVVDIVVSKEAKMSFELQHELVCVECGKKEYVPSDGKTGRTMKAICPECKEKRNAKASNESKGEQEVIPARRSGKAS